MLRDDLKLLDMNKSAVIPFVLVFFISVNSIAQTDTLPAKKDTVAGNINSTNVASESTPSNTGNTNISASANQTNQPVYKLKWAVDIPVVVATAGFSLYMLPKIYDKDPSSQTEINLLRKEDINGFDRWVAGNRDEKAEKTSDLFFYASMPLPLLLLLDKDIRKDGPKIGLLYLEAMSITGVFYTGSNAAVNRFRPETYDVNHPENRTSGNFTNSFIGGHPALVATSTFFIAKVYGDYHPDSKFKWVLYGTAAAATGVTAYLRLKAGKHFPSDLLAGITVGTLSGILTPHFHKNKLFKNPNLSIRPFTGDSHGLVVTYKL